MVYGVWSILTYGVTFLNTVRDEKKSMFGFVSKVSLIGYESFKIKIAFANSSHKVLAKIPNFFEKRQQLYPIKYKT